jgi:hypothetical protein
MLPGAAAPLLREPTIPTARVGPYYPTLTRSRDGVNRRRAGSHKTRHRPAGSPEFGNFFSPSLAGTVAGESKDRRQRHKSHNGNDLRRAAPVDACLTDTFAAGRLPGLGLPSIPRF